MGEVLLFNIEKTKAAKIKLLCRSLFIGSREIDKTEFGHSMAHLLGASNDASAAEEADFSGEMLYLADLSDSAFNNFLDRLRKKKIPVALKAVKTETNLGYTPCELFRELEAERAALQSGKTAHGSSEK